MNTLKSVLQIFQKSAAENGLSVKTSLDTDVSPSIQKLEDRIEEISPCSVATNNVSRLVVV